MARYKPGESIPVPVAPVYAAVMETVEIPDEQPEPVQVGPDTTQAEFMERLKKEADAIREQVAASMPPAPKTYQAIHLDSDDLDEKHIERQRVAPVYHTVETNDGGVTMAPKFGRWKSWMLLDHEAGKIDWSVPLQCRVIRQKYGLRHSQMTTLDRMVAAAKRNQDLTMTELAGAISSNAQTVGSILEKIGARPKQARAVLSPDVVDKILELRRNGMSMNAIAKAVGVSATTVQRICNGNGFGALTTMANIISPPTVPYLTVTQLTTMLTTVQGSGATNTLENFGREVALWVDQAMRQMQGVS